MPSGRGKSSGVSLILSSVSTSANSASAGTGARGAKHDAVAFQAVDVGNRQPAAGERRPRSHLRSPRHSASITRPSMSTPRIAVPCSVEHDIGDVAEHTFGTERNGMLDHAPREGGRRITCAVVSVVPSWPRTDDAGFQPGQRWGIAARSDCFAAHWR